MWQTTPDAPRHRTIVCLEPDLEPRWKMIDPEETILKTRSKRCFTPNYNVGT